MDRSAAAFSIIEQNINISSLVSARADQQYHSCKHMLLQMQTCSC